MAGRNGLDIWSPAFVDRFAAYAAAAARIVKSTSAGVPFYCPINEMSFHAWGGGDGNYLILRPASRLRTESPSLPAPPSPPCARSSPSNRARVSCIANR